MNSKKVYIHITTVMKISVKNAIAYLLLALLYWSKSMYSVYWKIHFWKVYALTILLFWWPRLDYPTPTSGPILMFRWPRLDYLTATSGPILMFRWPKLDYLTATSGQISNYAETNRLTGRNQKKKSTSKGRHTCVFFSGWTTKLLPSLH